MDIYLLGNCTKVHFEPDELTIPLSIQTDQDDEFCPTSVEILLKNEEVYNLSMPEGDWHGIDKRNNRKYRAFNMNGKLLKF